MTYHQQPGYHQQPRGTNGMAIAALVCAFVFAPVGIVLGIIAKKQIRRTGEDGSGLATAGIVLGSIFTVLGIIAIILWIVALYWIVREGGDVVSTLTFTS